MVWGCSWFWDPISISFDWRDSIVSDTPVSLTCVPPLTRTSNSICHATDALESPGQLFVDCSRSGICLIVSPGLNSNYGFLFKNKVSTPWQPLRVWVRSADWAGANRYAATMPRCARGSTALTLLRCQALCSWNPNKELSGPARVLVPPHHCLLTVVPGPLGQTCPDGKQKLGTNWSQGLLSKAKKTH